MNPIDTVIFDEPQLFVDSDIIESIHSVARRWHKPRRDAEPVIVQDQPWEEGLYFTYSNYTVLDDPADGKIKCWYEETGRRDGKTHPHLTSLLYAESTDGVGFEKPALDICRVDADGAGARGTNIVMGYAKGQGATAANPWGDRGAHSNAVLINPHPATPDWRFLTVFCEFIRRDGRWRQRTTAARSRDGIHWQPFDQRPSYGSSGDHLGDVSCLWYDHDSRQFVQNTRHGLQYNAARLPPRTPRVSNCRFAPYWPNRPDLMNKRRIFQARSHDFIHWTEPLEICRPDDACDNLDEAYYGMSQFSVGRQHFGLLGVFDAVDNGMHVRLMHSRDGVTWRATDNAAPFLAPRREGYWDAFMVSMTSPPIERDGQWLFHHGGSNAHHDWWWSGADNLDCDEARHPENVRFCLGLARLRKEGFASLYAGPVRDGVVQTKPVGSDGDRLVINAACAKGGSIAAEVTDLRGEVVGDCSMERCDAFDGDDVARTVTWGGSPEVPGGGLRTGRRIRFLLRNAHLYSFRMPEPSPTSADQAAKSGA